MNKDLKPGFYDYDKQKKIRYEIEYHHIVDNIKQIQRDIKSQIPGIGQLVNQIIKHKIKEEHEIESILDCLSGHITMGIGKKEYDKLLDYYEGINPGNAKCYRNFDKKYLGR